MTDLESRVERVIIHFTTEDSFTSEAAEKLLQGTKRTYRALHDGLDWNGKDAERKPARTYVVEVPTKDDGLKLVRILQRPEYWDTVRDAYLDEENITTQ